MQCRHQRKKAVAKSTCVMFKVPGRIYCKTLEQNNVVVAVLFFFLPSFNKLKRSEKTFTMGMKNRNEEEKDFLKKKLNKQVIIIIIIIIIMIKIKKTRNKKR